VINNTATLIKVLGKIVSLQSILNHIRRPA
jgi:hypothetical protein